MHYQSRIELTAEVECSSLNVIHLRNVVQLTDMQGPSPTCVAVQPTASIAQKESTLFRVELLYLPFSRTTHKTLFATTFLTTTMSDQTQFRLFELPGELVEYVSLFFDASEAHKLLTVSRVFHDLFSKRVWWRLDSRVFSLPQPARSMAIAKYCKVVRYIDLEDGFCNAIKPVIEKGVSVYDILSVFSCVTILKMDVHQFKSIKMYFPNLYKIDIEIEENNDLSLLDTLTLAILHRQKVYNMNPIEYLRLVYNARNTDDPWARLSNFVQTIISNCEIKIRITTRFSTRILPSVSELQVLSRYLTSLPDIAEQHDTQFCYAALNHLLFWKSPHLYSSCIYTRPRKLVIRTCCLGSDTYDYCDITPINFPGLQSMVIHGHECNNMTISLYPPAWKKVLLQTWPHLDKLKLSIDTIGERFVAVLKFNHGLTILRIWLHPKTLDDNNVFNLATILPPFPKLQQLFIFGDIEMKLDYSPNYDDSSILAQSQLILTLFDGLYLSTHICKLVFSLPKLNMIYINRCQFYSTYVTGPAKMDSLINSINEIDMDDSNDNSDDGDDGDSTYEELMVMINTISIKYLLNNPCVIKRFALGHNDDYDWPLDFTVEMIALMPELHTFAFTGKTYDIPIAVKTRFPYIKITGYS
ncbi:hypothetical protein GQ42DRAFT_32611 [Ramicandelaber brevisporus]|nr:hypothetical protein GQ42DRAFT_32611 [Ramicandelaber brevisporus]